MVGSAGSVLIREVSFIERFHCIHDLCAMSTHYTVPMDRTAPDTLCAKENTEGIGNLCTLCVKVHG